MINLLPQEIKQQIRAARLNVILIRYLAFLSIGSLFLAGASFGVDAYLNNQEETAKQLASLHSSSQTPDAITEQEAATFRLQLSEMTTILNQSPSYANGLINISRHIPDGVVLTTVSLDSSTLTSPTTIEAVAKSTDIALAIEQKFLQSPQLFSAFTIQSMTNDSGDQEYPVNVRFSVIINRGAY